MPPAYGLTFGNLSLSFRNVLVPFLRFSDVTESGGCESVSESVFNVETVDCVDSVAASKRQAIFLKRYLRLCVDVC